MNISPEFNNWTISNVTPLKPGIYQIKILPIKGLNQTEWSAQYRPNLINGLLHWDVPAGFIVTHWKF